MKYSVKWAEDICSVEFVDDVTIRDIELANKDVHGDLHFFQTSGSKWDFTKCTAINLKFEELSYTVAVDLGSTAFMKEYRLAIVAQDENARNVFMQYASKLQKSGTPWDIEIFDSGEEADRWLKG